MSLGLILVVSRVTGILVDPMLLVSILLKVFKLCLSSPLPNLFFCCFEIGKTMLSGSEPCHPPEEWLVSSVSKVGTTSVWRTLCPPGVTLVWRTCWSGKVLHTAVLCVRMCCVLMYMCMCMCVCTCVCMWPYVCLCSISAVFFTFFGNLFGISTNDPPFHWLF